MPRFSKYADGQPSGVLLRALAESAAQVPSDNLRGVRIIDGWADFYFIGNRTFYPFRGLRCDLKHLAYSSIQVFAPSATRNDAWW